MADDDIRAWDSVGRAMGAAGEVWEAMVRRNVEVWSTVASNLRKVDYTADDMVGDAARGMTAQIDNLRDVWTVLTTPPFGQADAEALPNRQIFFSPSPPLDRKPETYTPSVGSVDIPVPPGVSRDKEHLVILFTGAADTARQLKESLTPTFLDDGTLTLGTQDIGKAEPGLYQGLVYVRQTPRARPLAHLWAVVDPADPTAP